MNKYTKYYETTALTQTGIEYKYRASELDIDTVTLQEIAYWAAYGADVTVQEISAEAYKENQPTKDNHDNVLQ